ncbi:MAG: hypothetical protein ACHQO8_09000 [Vicinamibacterales bacterium]
MTTFYLAIRVLHVLCGAIWVGMAVFGAFFLMPAIGDVGPDGGKVMAALERRGFVAFIPIIAALSVLSGLWLYWHYTGGFSPEISRTHAGMTFGIGGILGIAAAIIGAGVVSRAMAKATKLSKEAAGMIDTAARNAALAAANQSRQRGQTGARFVAVLLILTVSLMSIALLL